MRAVPLYLEQYRLLTSADSPLGERDKEAIVDGLDAEAPVAATIASMSDEARAGLLADVRAAAGADGLLGPRELALLAEVESALASRTPA